MRALTQAQSDRFAALDPLLPAAVDPPPGELVTAALPGGEQVVGVVVETVLPQGAPQTLWSGMRSWELFPVLGATDGMAELLRAWPPGPGGDTACVVTWPSRDARASRALLDHGFTPLSVLAVRTAPPERVPLSDVDIRFALPADLDALVELAVAEVAYSALVGGAVLRPDAADIRRAALTAHLDRGDLVWLAERDGVPVGYAEGWHTDSVPGSWAETRVRHGRWGYVNCLSVAPEARGTGVGRALMDVAHHELIEPGTAGAFLYYNPPNPVSPTFWARQGYRPLWTVWEVRPASARR